MRGRNVVARVGPGKAAADVERGNLDMRRIGGAPREFDRLSIGEWAQALRADMERNSGIGARARDALQEPAGIGGRGAEFAGQFQHRSPQGRGDADENPQPFAALCLAEQFVELLIAVDDEILEAVVAPRRSRFTRNSYWGHEMAVDVRVTAANQLYFGKRGSIEMADSGLVDLVKHVWRGIGLDRVHRRAGKEIDEAPRGIAKPLWMQSVIRQRRPRRFDQCGERRIMRERLARSRRADGRLDVHGCKPHGVGGLS